MKKIVYKGEMKKIILALSIILFSNFSYAEIGKSVDDFKQKEFIERANFQLENEYILEEGRIKTYLFKDKHVERYSIELTVDEEKIAAQSLAFPDAPTGLIAEIDVSVMTDFIQEAIGESDRDKINKVLTDMLKVVAKKPTGKKKANKNLKGYRIEISHYQTANWEVIVKKSKTNWK